MDVPGEPPEEPIYQTIIWRKGLNGLVMCVVHPNDPQRFFGMFILVYSTHTYRYTGCATKIVFFSQDFNLVFCNPSLYSSNRLPAVTSQIGESLL